MITSITDSVAAPGRSTGQSEKRRSMPVTRTKKPALAASAAGVPYSSMAIANTSSRLAAMPGVASGNVMRRKQRHGEPPQTRPTSASREPDAEMLRETAKYTTGKTFSVMTNTTPQNENRKPAACTPASCST